MIERERLIEIGASVVGVGLMVATLYVIGLQHAEEANGHQVLSPTGGELVVYSIIGFIAVMAAVGVLLMRTVTVVEAGDGADSA